MSLRTCPECGHAAVNPKTGIVQIDAVIDGDSLSFALDNGAAYSFVDSVVLGRLAKRHPDWSRLTGAIGCANMWGWWPPRSRHSPSFVCRRSCGDLCDSPASASSGFRPSTRAARRSEHGTPGKPRVR